MKNVLDVTSANTPFGGTVAKLRVLATHSSDNHIIYFFCGRNNIEIAKKEELWYIDNRVKTYYGGFGINSFLQHVFYISKIIRREKIDVINFYFNAETPLVIFLKVLHPKVKYVRSFVGYIKTESYKKVLIRYSIKKVDACIYISNYIKRSYEHDFPSLKDKHCRIIYNGPVNIAESTKLQKERQLITYVGGINKHKNVPLLISMMNVIVNQYGRKEIKLTVIGDGDRSLVTGMISEYHLENNILLLGYKKEVSEYLNNTKVYVHSATNEGFGISVVEAMYMKCPCLVANASALPELMDDSCGYVLPYNDPNEWADKLIKLVDNAELRQSMGESAFKRAKEMFSVDKFVRNHDNFYNNL